MSKSSNVANTTAVKAYIQKLDLATASLVEAIRRVILSADKTVGEQIKWNAPAFFYTGEMKAFDPKEYKRDIVVMNLRQKGYILLIFPTGATIKDTSGLLEGDYEDGRRMVKIIDKADLKKKEKGLLKIIQTFLKNIDKVK